MIAKSGAYVVITWHEFTKACQRIRNMKNHANYLVAVNRGLRQENERLRKQIKADLNGRIRKIDNELKVVHSV